MTSKNMDNLKEHEGHKLNIASYEDKVVLECISCEEELLVFTDNKEGKLEIRLNEED